MVRGLAMAETTPGHLIMVVQFVAFLGAYRHPGSLDPWLAAVVAALLTHVGTFEPCFVIVFVGAPYVERLRGNHALSSALTGVTAAVVGVIANLAVFFALHTLFDATRTLTVGPHTSSCLSSPPWTPLASASRSSRLFCCSASSGRSCAHSAPARRSVWRPATVAALIR